MDAIERVEIAIRTALVAGCLRREGLHDLSQQPEGSPPSKRNATVQVSGADDGERDDVRVARPSSMLALLTGLLEVEVLHATGGTLDPFQ